MGIKRMNIFGDPQATTELNVKPEPEFSKEQKQDFLAFQKKALEKGFSNVQIDCMLDYYKKGYDMLPVEERNNSVYSDKFIARVKDIYPNYKEAHVAAERGNYVLGKYLCDFIDQISDDDILAASSLEELKKKEDKIQKQQKLYSDFRAGRCYVNRRSHMCSRSYAQGACDAAVMDAFVYPKVFHIPSCFKFKTGE